MVGALLLLLVAEGQATAFIAGRITDQGSGQPLPRMVVTLVAPDRSRRESITDADGAYRFAGLPPGKYAVGAGPDEHRSTYLRQWYGETVSAAPFSGPQRPSVELTSGEARTGIDIALTRALGIEGRVFNPWDEPMADVEVTVSGADGRVVAGRSAYSDDQGAYRLYGLAPGRYRVCVNVREGADVVAPDGSTLVKTCHPAAIQEAQGGDVTLTSQDASGIDIRVQRLGSYSMSGVVIDGAGRPVDGAHVNAFPSEMFAGSAYARTRNGAFALKGLTPGRYTVVASIGGLYPGDPNPPARELETGYAKADVTGVDTTGISIALTRAVTVSGRIAFDGPAVPDARRLQIVVQAQPEDDTIRAYGGRPPFAAVKDDLTFELGSLHRLPMMISLRGLPDGWAVRSMRYGDREIMLTAIDFASGPSSRQLEVTLTSTVARPSVRVTDDQGAPVAAYSVVAVPADPAKWRAGLIVIPGSPSMDGVLKLGALLPGEYLLAALSAPEFILLMRDRERVDGLAAIGTRATLRPDDTRTIDLRLVRLPDKR